MHESVAAQDRIASGQLIAGDIGEMIFTFYLSRRGTGLQVLDQRWYDVDAYDAHAQVSMVDPAGVAAGGIKKRGHPEFFEKPRQLRAQRGGGVHLRAQSGSGRHGTPQVGVVDAPKALGEIQARKGFPVLKKPQVREDGRAV